MENPIKKNTPPNRTLRSASVPSHSDNRRICGSLTLAQISQGETSHIPRTLSEIGLRGGMKNIKNRRDTG